MDNNAPATSPAGTRPQYVTHDDVVAVRAGEHNPEVCENLWRGSKCAQCRQKILDRTRLRFVVSGLAWVSFVHVNEQTCLTNIEAAKAKKKNLKTGGLVIKPKPAYAPRKADWTLSEEEEFQILLSEHFGFIQDHRYPRRSVVCRLCGSTIDLFEDRCAFKLHDPETKWTLKQGFVHASCITPLVQPVNSGSVPTLEGRQVTVECTA